MGLAFRNRVVQVGSEATDRRLFVVFLYSVCVCSSVRSRFFYKWRIEAEDFARRYKQVAIF